MIKDVESHNRHIVVKRVEKLEAFFKEVFLINGESSMKGFYKLISPDGDHHDALTFKLSDSVRGEFLVSIVNIHENNKQKEK